MTAAVVAGGLVVLALLDGAFAGFRSGHGRDGRIRRGASGLLDHVRGGVAVLVVLVPVVVVASLDVVGSAHRLEGYRAAGSAMLAVYAPYGGVVLLAVAAYVLLGWRHRFLASALILGPFTFLRPAVAVGGGVAGAVAARDGLVAVLVVAAVVAVLLVEPLLDRWWRRRAPEAGLVSARGPHRS